MDRNSAIGLTLIAAMMLGYFWYTSKTQPPVQPQTQSAAPTTPNNSNTVAEPVPAVQDSILTAAYGDFSDFLKGEEKVSTIETGDLKINFSNKGGIIQYLELKNFKTYTEKPLILVEPSNSSFKLLTKFKGEEID